MCVPEMYMCANMCMCYTCKALTLEIWITSQLSCLDKLAKMNRQDLLFIETQ